MSLTTTTKEEAVRNHPIYWFEDGSLVLDVDVQRFKVHHSLLSRHSKFFSALTLKGQGLDKEVAPHNGPSGFTMSLNYRGGTRHVVLQPKRQAMAVDVEALLGHFYHDVPLSKESTFAHISSILRITGPQQLDFPHLHKTACDIFVGMFPTDPTRPLKHSAHLHDALSVATEFNLKSARKAILYYLVTTTDFDVSESPFPGATVDPQNVVKSVLEAPGLIPENNVALSVTSASPTLADTNAIDLPETDTPSEVSPIPATDPAVVSLKVAETSEFTHTLKPMLSRTDSETCMSLMTRIISHFTPILFTPGATPHMGCTDVFADTWMTLVIQPAIEDDGVYKPLETLQRMKEINWERYGLCASCVVEKKEEWSEEQRRVWELMDGWV